MMPLPDTVRVPMKGRKLIFKARIEALLTTGYRLVGVECSDRIVLVFGRNDVQS